MGFLRGNYKGGALRNGISVLLKETPENSVTLSGDERTVRRQPSMHQEAGSSDKEPARAVILNFQSPEW